MRAPRSIWRGSGGWTFPSFGTPRDTKRFAPSEKTEVMRMCISPTTNMPLPIWLPDIQRLLIILALDALSAMVDEVGDPCFDEYEGDERMTRGVVVRHLMLPGALEDSKRVVQTVWEHFGSSVLLSIMNQYTPVLAESAKAGDAWACRELERCSELARRVPNEDYERLLDFADSLGIEDYFWQEGGAAEESFIPAFDLEGVLSE